MSGLPLEYRQRMSGQSIESIADVVDARYRALLLLLRYTGLTWSEAVALRRRRCFVTGTLEICEKAIETPQGVRFRMMARESWSYVRDGVRDALVEHLVRFVDEDRNALVFTNPAGAPLQRQDFEEDVWQPGLRLAGLLEDDLRIEGLQALRLMADISEACEQRRQLTAEWGKGGGHVA